MIKKNPQSIVNRIENVKSEIEEILSDYLENYADYGMDDIANDMICLIANLEVIRCKIEHSDVREENDVNLY
jgi:hypothetical protein